MLKGQCWRAETVSTPGACMSCGTCGYLLLRCRCEAPWADAVPLRAPLTFGGVLTTGFEGLKNGFWVCRPMEHVTALPRVSGCASRLLRDYVYRLRLWNLLGHGGASIAPPCGKVYFINRRKRTLPAWVKSFLHGRPPFYRLPCSPFVGAFGQIPAARAEQKHCGKRSANKPCAGRLFRLPCDSCRCQGRFSRMIRRQNRLL